MYNPYVITLVIILFIVCTVLGDLARRLKTLEKQAARRDADEFSLFARVSDLEWLQQEQDEQEKQQ